VSGVAPDIEVIQDPKFLGLAGKDAAVRKRDNRKQLRLLKTTRIHCQA